MTTTSPKPAGRASLLKPEAKKLSILDETFDFAAEHVVATQAQLDAMTLYAAATHGIRGCVTFGRMLFTSHDENSGKTLAMMVTATLSSRPVDTAGTQYSVDSAVASASNEPEKSVPALFRDEISDVFGKSGLNGSNHPIAEYLRKGYKHGATRKRSVSRVDEEYSIFTPFLMTGLRTAVPRDIRSRCIVIDMQRGSPSKYFSVRDSEPYARELSKALDRAVKQQIDEIRAFRGRGIHARLTGRHLEVWEPLLAVAYALGGQRWLNRAVAAFCELAIDESDVTVLTPRQAILRDLAAVAEASGEAFAGGMKLADELQRIDDPKYAGRSHASLCCLIRDTVPFESEQRRINGAPVRGYSTAALTDAWETSKPPEQDDSLVPEEENPFDVTDENAPVTGNTPLTSGVTGVTGVTGVDGPDRRGIIGSDEHRTENTEDDSPGQDR